MQKSVTSISYVRTQQKLPKFRGNSKPQVTQPMASLQIFSAVETQDETKQRLFSCKPIMKRKSKMLQRDRSLQKGSGQCVDTHPHHNIANRVIRIQRLGETYLLVGHCVIPPEKSCSDVVSHHHVHSVVVMSKEDAEHPSHAECPAKPVIPPESPWGICKEAQAGC